MKPPLNPVVITSDDQLHLVESFLERTFIFGLDLETNVTPTFYDRFIRTITIGDKNEQYIIDLLGFAHWNRAALISSQSNYGAAADMLFGRLISLLRRVLEKYDPLHTAKDARDWVKVGANLQFDYEMLKWNLGIRMWNFYDMYLAEKKIHAGLVHYMASGFWGMENIVGRYCGLLVEDHGKSFDTEEPLTQTQIDYAALDVRLPLAVRFGQMRILESEGLARAAQIEFDAIPAFGDMYLNGFNLDNAAWMAIVNRTIERQRMIVTKLDEFFVPIVGAKHITPEDEIALKLIEDKWRGTKDDKVLRAQYRKQYMVLRKSINDRRKLGEKCEGEACINYGSPAQLRDALWVSKKYSKTKLPNTNDATLEKLSEFPKLDITKAFEDDGGVLNYPIIDLIRLYRSTDKALTTYGVWWTRTLDERDPNDKDVHGYKNPFTLRIHSKINQIGAATGRTSSSSPNIQNIPRESVYRLCFVAGVGMLLVTVDMSGAELRILAELSGEPIWLEAFKRGWDVHSVCAEIIFGKEWEEGAEDGCAFKAKHEKCKCKKHKKLREVAKTLNFGLAYGMGPQKLADAVGITFEEAVVVFELFKRSFPTVFNYLERSGKDAATILEARDMTGGRRKWRRPTWEDAKQKAAEKCKAGASPTQEQIRKTYRGMFGAIEREGKNSKIQGTNAMFIKLAMGCGFDPEGQPYLWHILEPKYKSLLVSMVHDELVNETPEAVAGEVKTVVGHAMTRASAEFMKNVEMETEGKVAREWSK
jgi:DNA polymerase I-like protein with 3'-5' exonuclease and polymerase domains